MKNHHTENKRERVKENDDWKEAGIDSCKKRKKEKNGKKMRKAIMQIEC